MVNPYWSSVKLFVDSSGFSAVIVGILGVWNIEVVDTGNIPGGRNSGRGPGGVVHLSIRLRFVPNYDFLAKWENSMVKVPLPWVELRKTVE